MATTHEPSVDSSPSPNRTGAQAPAEPRASSPPGTSGRFTGIRRLAVALALPVVLALLVSSDRLHAVLLRVFERAGAVIAERPVMGVVLFVALSALGAMVVFVSSTVLVPAALLAWGGPRTVLLLWLAWMLAAVVAYTVARRLGRPAVAWLVSRRALELYEARIPKQAPMALVLLFQLAVPSEIAGYILGLARYPFGKYLGAVALAELPYAVAVTLVGATLLERHALLLVATGAAGAVIALLAVRALRRRLPAHEAPPRPGGSSGTDGGGSSRLPPDEQPVAAA